LRASGWPWCVRGLLVGWLAEASSTRGGFTAAEDFFEGGAAGEVVVEEGGIDVVEIVEFFAFHLLLDEAFDGLCVFEFLAGNDGEGIAFLIGSTGASDAVDVILGIFRYSVIDDVGDVGDIEAAGGDICGDNDIEGAVAEAAECFGAFGLADIRVHDGGFVTLFDEHVVDFVAFRLGAGEDHDRVEIRGFEECEEEVGSLFVGDWIEGVGDGIGYGDAHADFDFDGVVEGEGCESLDLRRHGCREEEGLAVLVAALLDDAADIREEAHVEHAVDFIEDEEIDGIEAEGAAFDVVEQASRGGDNNVHAGFEVVDLATVGDAAVEQEGADVGIA